MFVQTDRMSLVYHFSRRGRGFISAKASEQRDGLGGEFQPIQARNRDISSVPQGAESTIVCVFQPMIRGRDLLLLIFENHNNGMGISCRTGKLV